eukprot:EC821381.1.p1 GENE.EC821381.1~~EC821381.1.p1  ORF type:complete len:141 (+),score=58.47 EC821381.1:53-424(+)
MNNVNDLPKEVICSILSFLSFKESIRTSSCCKKWRKSKNFFQSVEDIKYFFYPTTNYKDILNIPSSYYNYENYILNGKIVKKITEHYLLSFSENLFTEEEKNKVLQDKQKLEKLEKEKKRKFK